MSLKPITIKLSDSALQRIFRKLADLDQKAATKAIRAGINESTILVLKAAKALVPVRTGQLRRSLGRKVKTYRASKVVVGLVGPRRGFRVEIDGKAVNPVKYAHLVEYGHGGPHGAAPKPFLRPAWDANKGKVAAILTRRINAAMRLVCKGR